MTLYDLGRRILTAIVDNDHLGRKTALLEVVLDSIQGAGQAVRLVEGGDHDRQLWRHAAFSTFRISARKAKSSPKARRTTRGLAPVCFPDRRGEWSTGTSTM